MPVYAYRGVTSEQKNTSGAIAADTPRQARDQLRARGIQVEWVAPQETGNSLSLWNAWRSRGSRIQWTLASRELAMLLTAGIPLVEALDTLAEQYRGHFRYCSANEIGRAHV